MTRVFISYRSDDDSFAAVQVQQRLSARFGAGNVFRDSSHVPPGVDFEPELWRNLAGSTVVVAVIGPRWLTGRGTENKLLRRADFVRRELEIAFDLGLPVVPVLIGDIPEPVTDDLPESLRNLMNHQYRRLYPRNAESSVEQFVDEIDKAYGDQPPVRSGTVAVVRAAAGPLPARLAVLVRRATAHAGLGSALVEELPTEVRVMQPDAAKAGTVGGDFVRALDDALGAEPELGQVRLALHYDDIAPMPDTALLAARRLAAEPVLDEVLRATSGARIVLVASDEFYQMAVRPGHRGVDRATFVRVRVVERDAWVQVPGFPAPRGLPAPPPGPDPRATTVNNVHGGPVNNFHTAGDVVFGDKVGGDKIQYGGRQ